MWLIVSASDFDVDCCKTLHIISIYFFWEPTVWGNFPIYATRLICWREAMCCHRRLPTWLMALIEIHFLSIRRWHSLSHTPLLCSPFIYRETQAAAAASLLSLKQQRSNRADTKFREEGEKKRKEKRNERQHVIYCTVNVMYSTVWDAEGLQGDKNKKKLIR